MTGGPITSETPAYKYSSIQRFIRRQREAV